MTDLDERLRRDLATLANQMPITNLTEASVRRGHAIRFRRISIAATAGVAIIVAAIVVPIAVAGDHRLTKSPTIPPTGLSTERLGSHDPRWRVAPNEEVVNHNGPAGQNLPPCTAKTLHATATTRRVTGGVAGIVTFRGDHCSITASDQPVRLIDRYGKPLLVPLVTLGEQKDVAGNSDSYLSLGAGSAAQGFLWTGSWCGQRAMSVQVPLGTPGSQEGHLSGSTTTVTLHGPSPSCQRVSDSTLRIGPYGAPSQSVLPAPASWDGLRAHLDVSPTAAHNEITGLSVELSNSTGRPISLDPCPEYGLVITSTNNGGAEGEVDGSAGAIGCSGPVRVVPAHGDITVPLRDAAFDPGEIPKPGSTVTITIGIAGMAPATAHSTVAG